MQIVKFFAVGITFLIILGLSVYYAHVNRTIPITVTPSLPADTTPDATPEVTNPYDPAQYGIPETIGGYKVIAVFTPQDFACIPEGQKRIILQAQELIQQPANSREILRALQEIPGEEETDWKIEFIGPNGTLKEPLELITTWNELMPDRPCFYLGGPQPTLMDTPSSE